MQPFTTLRGRVAFLDWTDVNTDLIIPARYLKRIERTGYGPLLFADKRYVAGGAPDVDTPETHGHLDPAFPLNASNYQGATILVVGRNFGCGSSREHAVWAIAQAGYRALIAPGKGEGFADIFEQNSLNNGLLPIELAEADWENLASLVRDADSIEATIDLRANTIAIHGSDAAAASFQFEISPEARERLLSGVDAIAETLQHASEIDAHERAMANWITPTTS